jgi:hypothetical protein
MSLRGPKHPAFGLPVKIFYRQASFSSEPIQTPLFTLIANILTLLLPRTHHLVGPEFWIAVYNLLTTQQKQTLSRVSAKIGQGILRIGMGIALSPE